MRISSAVAFGFLGLCPLGCNDLGPELAIGSADILFATSFESAIDTMGWGGYGGVELVSSACPGGGKQSVRVSGGCLVPHAVLRKMPTRLSGAYSIRCWGKNLVVGGSVALYRSRDPHKTIWLSIRDTNWAAYSTDSVLVCLATDTLVATLNAGGIVPSAMLVDSFVVCRMRQ
jgi:hypothetical protein